LNDTVCFGDRHIRRGPVDDGGTRCYAVVTFSDGTCRPWQNGEATPPRRD